MTFCHQTAAFNELLKNNMKLRFKAKCTSNILKIWH